MFGCVLENTLENTFYTFCSYFLTFSRLPNEYIISFIPQNTNKTQKKNHQILTKGEIAIGRSRSLSAIEIAIAIYRDQRDRDLDRRSRSRPRSQISIVDRDRDLDRRSRSQSMPIVIAIDADRRSECNVLSLSLTAFVRLLCFG